MKLYFIGADREVTGSCHVLEVNGKYIMLDCGLEQGRDIYVNEDLPVSASEIDAVLLSMRTSIIPACCQNLSKTASTARSGAPMPQNSCAISC